MAALDLDTELPAIAQGDADAFARWLAAAEPALRQALRPAAAQVDVEALLQEGLLRIWQVAPRVRPDGDPNALLRFGITVLRNLVHSELRRTRPELSPQKLEAELERRSDDAPPAAPDPLLRRLIARCREKLPPRPAQALMARLGSAGSDSDETLAQRLGMRVNTFLQNITRARKLLADCLRAQGYTVEEP